VALLVVLSVSAMAGTVVYWKHRKAQQTLAQQESDQFSSQSQIEVRATLVTTQSKAHRLREEVMGQMDMIMQGIQLSKEETGEARPKTVTMNVPTTTTEEEEAEEAEQPIPMTWRTRLQSITGNLPRRTTKDDQKPNWRMRIKSITARSPTILVEGSNTSRRPVPLGAIVAAGRPQQQGGKA
jgi:hypothetical protein